MIIRRRHTANFTTIGNALFEDKRLAADEVGILAWLLSRPHDWEVRRPALMRRWEIGAVSCKRIFNNWLRTGWAQARKTRLSNGTFHIVYEIRDEPGRDLQDDEIREALSLVSSEAVDDDSSDDTATDHPHVTERPPPCQRGVDDQGVATAPRSIEDSLNIDSENTESPNEVRALARVLDLWPLAHVLSRVTAESALAGLSEKDFADCERGISPYLSECKIASRKICDLTTFIRERRWERFTTKPAASTLFHVKPRTPEAWRWREYLERSEPEKLKTFDLAMDRNGYTAPSQWPPPLPPKREPEAKEETLCTEDDMKQQL